MADLKTCRFCGMSNYEYNHPAAKSKIIKYGTRHNAHLKCAVEAQGMAFIQKLMTWQIEALPYFEIQDLGIESEVRRILEERKQNHAA